MTSCKVTICTCPQLRLVQGDVTEEMCIRDSGATAHGRLVNRCSRTCKQAVLTHRQATVPAGAHELDVYKRQTLHKLIERGLDLELGTRIDGARSLIEQQNRRIGTTAIS